MFLTNGPGGNNLGAYGNGNIGYNGTNYGEGRVGAHANGGAMGGGEGYSAGGNGGGGLGGGGVCFNCGKPGHFARDCWAWLGKPYQHNQGDPELEEIKEYHRQAMRERIEQKEKKRIEEEKKAKEEEENRRNQDFARKMEEFKLQLRVDLNEEWRKKNLEAERATLEAKKKTVTRRLNQGSRSKKSNGKGRRTRFTELSNELVPRFVRNAKNITKPGRGVHSEAVLQAILDATKHQKGRVSRPELLPGTFRCEKHRSLAWTDEAKRDWGKRFAGQVLTQVDRNSGDTTVFCPVLYRHGFGKLFTWNTNYITVGRAKEEAELMKKYREDFRECGLESIGEWKPNGRLGTAYVIPKHKDLERWRPIAPASSDPAALAKKRVARALHTLLCRLPVHESFYLNSISKLSERLGATTVRLKASGCTKVEGRCYNIKEMFFRIPHSEVVHSVESLLKRYIDKGWRYVKVSFHGKACVISETKKRLDGYVSISLPALLKAVHYDLQHSSIRCGGKLMQKVFGIPMGKSTSPILTSITCAMSERKLLGSLGSDRKLVGGWRIMDDIFVIVGSSDTSGRCPEDIFRAFEECYDTKLEIVRKDDCGVTWSFVGGTFFIGNKPLQQHFVPNGKNTDALYEKGKMVFQTMQDYSSYSDKAVKKTVWAATLRRLWDHTMCKKLVLGAIALAVCEADLRGYAPEVSLGALAKLAKTARNEYVDKMLAIFRCAAALGR
ncbi:hypothetical protein CBR_g3603 [Chara braunii]|uniref:CCHC-type domain-containing protein n=1 Tax=Chara braunii TaxID=69332 RepID=A0A388KFS2_CHABU|nr:hypothetical protein CBR_g3603 [Chara braunii]|eukprot:GBG68904.1 hypothetical protein CBR_g3603 [Chara braunii]